MTPEQIIQLLDQLGQRLEGPAKYVFDLAVRQVLIDGAYNLFVVITSLILITLLVKLFLRVKRWAFTDVHTRSDEMDAQMLTAFAGMGTIVLSILSLLIGVSSAHSAMNYLLNPEYWTLVRLANLVVPQ